MDNLNLTLLQSMHLTTLLGSNPFPATSGLTIFLPLLLIFLLATLTASPTLSMVRDRTATKAQSYSGV